MIFVTVKGKNYSVFFSCYFCKILRNSESRAIEISCIKIINNLGISKEITAKPKDQVTCHSLSALK